MLLKSLSPIIGAEVETGKAVAKGWADAVPKSKIAAWSSEGQKLTEELETYIVTVFSDEYARLMRQVRVPYNTRHIESPH